MESFLKSFVKFLFQDLDTPENPKINRNENKKIRNNFRKEYCKLITNRNFKKGGFLGKKTTNPRDLILKQFITQKEYKQLKPKGFKNRRIRT